MRFEGKTVLITGAGSGIGQATALQFAGEGAFVFVADVNEEHGQGTVSRIVSQGGDARFVLCDVSKPEQLQNLVDEALQHTRRLDIVVNNAAKMQFAPLVDLSMEQWDQVFHVNLRSVFLLCKFAVPHIRGGAIVNISSVHAHKTTANNSPYAASKGGLEALTRALSRELEPKVCRVNSLAPGSVNTPMLWSNPNLKNGQEHLAGQVAEPEDIATAICFLASEEARFIHGANLIVDGGRLDIL